MNAFDVLGDPVRRRLFELLARGERAAGDVGAVVEREFDITQSAVSQHLRVLRDSGLARMRADGARRLYAVNPRALDEVDAWVAGCRRFWSHKLDALDTELARGARRSAARGAARAGTRKRSKGGRS